jgi:hypothetical protein
MVDGAVVWMTHCSLFWWLPSPSHTQVPMPGKLVWFVDWQCCWPETTQKSSPQSAGGGGGGGGGLYVLRGPQSVQSVPSLHQAAEEPAPPSSHMPFDT